MLLHIKRNGHADYFRRTDCYFNNKHESAENQKVPS